MKDKLQFYSKSADKLPGVGAGEYIENIADYIPLSKITNWRHMLSNFYVSPFMVDGHKWNSMEHFYHACKFRNPSTYDYYLTFTYDGGEPWSRADGPTAWAAGQAGKQNSKGIVTDRKVLGKKLPKDVIMINNFFDIKDTIMTIGFFAKFSQNPLLKDMLLKTNDADLVHYVSSRRSNVTNELWNNLMKVRECIRKYDDKYDLSFYSNFSVEEVNEMLA